MMYSERKNQIVELLRGKSMSVRELSEKLSVSEMTVRRDIEALKSEGIVTQHRGGVALQVSQSFKSFEIRAVSEKDDKIRIAKKAASYVRDGMFIFIDNSSSSYYIVPFLKDYKDLKVITNSLAVASGLGDLGISVKLACGNYNTRDKSVVGSETEAYIKNYRYDIAFLSSSGYNDRVIMSYSEANTHIRRAVLVSAERSIFLMSPSKKNRNSKFVLCKIEDVEMLT